MNFSTIASAIGASWQGVDNAFINVVTDSRAVKKGDCFVAIKGQQHDGHHFIHEAVKRGAGAIVASIAPQADWLKTVSYLQVTNTIQALGQWAAFWRDQYTTPVVGITGSCGKTTVKGIVDAICRTMGKTLSTAGNYNNEIGLPLTLLRLDPTYRYVVIEMGASAKGDITYLGQLAKPTISMITNVAPAHLEGFGSLFGVAEAKGEIYSILPDDGVAIVNNEEAYGDYWRTCIQGRKIMTFGLSARSQVYATAVELLPQGVAFTLHFEQEAYSVRMKIPGKHTVLNALAGVCVGAALRIPVEKIIEGLEAFEGVPGRLCRFPGVKGAHVIDDSYNANPGSVGVALDVLATQAGQTIFVMGDMAELGNDVSDYHAKVGVDARQKGISKLLAVGEWSKQAVIAFGEGAAWYPTQAALIEALRDTMDPETVILVKGSRRSQMEGVTQAIIQPKE